MASEEKESVLSTDLYYRALYILNVAGGTVLRAIFNKQHPPELLQRTLSSNYYNSKLHKLKRTKKVCDYQWDCIYPNDVPPESGKFDTKLILTLLKSICREVTPPVTGWTLLPQQADTSIGADIVRLSRIETVLTSRLRVGSISNQTYEKLKNDLFDILTRLASHCSQTFERRFKEAFPRVVSQSLLPYHKVDLITSAQLWYSQDGLQYFRRLKNAMKPPRVEVENLAEAVTKLKKDAGSAFNIMKGICTLHSSTLCKFDNDLNTVLSRLWKLSQSRKVTRAEIDSKLKYGRSIIASLLKEFEESMQDSSKKSTEASKYTGRDVDWVIAQDVDDDNTEQETEVTTVNANTALKKDTRTNNHLQIQKHLIKIYESWASVSASVSPVLDIPEEAVEISLQVICGDPTESIGRDIPFERFRNKLVTSYTDICREEGRKINRVVMYGKAGIGKSTWCKHLVTAWCQAQQSTRQHRPNKGDADNTSFLKSIDLLFYLQSKFVSKEQTLEEIISSQLFAQSYSDSLQMTGLRNLPSSDANILIIIDGLDELSSNNSALNDAIFCRSHKNCKVLITTRPWKMEEMSIHFPVNVDRLVEAQGFDSARIRAFVKVVSENNVEYHKSFLEAIDKANMRCLAQVPVLLFLLCQVWKQRGELHTSTTDVYISVVELLLKNCERTLTGQFSNMNLQHQIVEKVPRLKSKLFQELGELCLAYGEAAYQCLLKPGTQSTVLSESQLIQLLKNKNDLLHIGLESGILVRFATPPGTQQPKYIAFIHRSVLKFFAAIWIAYKEKLRPLVSELYTVADVLDNTELVKFLCSLSPTQGRCVFSRLQNISRHDPDIANSISSLKVSPKVASMTAFLMECRREMPEIRTTGKNVLPIKHFYVSQDDTSVAAAEEHDQNIEILVSNREVLKSFTYEFHRVEISHTEKLISYMKSMNSLIGLSLECPFPEHVIPELSEVLKGPTYMKALKVVNIHHGLCPKAVFTLPELYFLNRLYLTNLTVRLESFPRLVSLFLLTVNLECLKIRSEDFRDLTKVTLWNVTMTPSTWDSCLIGILEATKLTQLSLQKIHLTKDHFRQTNNNRDRTDSYREHKWRFWDLKDLCIDDVPLNSSTSNMLSELFHRSCGLVYLSLADVNLSDTSVSLVANKTLEELTLERVSMGESEWKSFGEGLPKTKCLHRIVLQELQARNIFLDLSNYSGLKELEIAGVEMPQDAWWWFSDHLQSKTVSRLHLQDLKLQETHLNVSKLKNLEELYFDNLSISRGACGVISMGIEKARLLKSLHLRSVDMYDAHLDLFRQKSLVTLTLDCIVMEASSWKVFMSSLPRLANLKRLWLQKLNLQDVDIEESSPIAGMRCLLELTLNDIQFSQKGWNRLFSGLESVQSLTKLKLATINIHDSNIILCEQSHLEELSLVEVGMDRDACICLAKSIERLRCLRCITMNSVYLHDISFDISKLEGLMSLTLRRTRITNSALKRFQLSLEEMQKKLGTVNVSLDIRQCSFDKVEIEMCIRQSKARL